jgi:hypothetical protein
MLLAGALMQTSSRPLTPQERFWVGEILGGHPEWSGIELDQLSVVAENITGNIRSMKLSQGPLQVLELRGTKGWIGRIEIRTADNFGITVTLDQHDGLLEELHVDFLDLDESGKRPQPDTWREIAHIYTKM